MATRKKRRGKAAATPAAETEAGATSVAALAAGADPGSVRGRLLAAGVQLARTFIRRDEAIQVVVMAHLTRCNYLLIGDPGTAKTAIARAFAQHITGGRFFATLLGAFTTPEKIFGPTSIDAFKQGRYEHVTDGYLPAVEMAFLDEVLKCSDGALNETLTILNERLFAGEPTPLMVVGSATNWPEVEARSEIVEALYDRFLLRCPVADLDDESEIADMLGHVDAAARYEPETTVSLDELRQAQAEVDAVPMSRGVRELLANVRNRVVWKNAKGRDAADRDVLISARRLGALQAVLRASAWLRGADEVTIDDFGALRCGLWVDRKDIEKVDSVLDSIDAEEVKKAIAEIDRGREAFASYQRSGHKGPGLLRDTMDAIRDAAGKARTLYERPVYTTRGRDDIRQAMTSLRGDFDALRKEAKDGGYEIEQGDAPAAQATDGGAQ